MTKLFYFLLPIVFLAISCDDDDNMTDPDPTPPNTEALSYFTTDTPVNTIYDNLISSLEANPNIGIVAQVDHTSNAANVNLTLRNTRLVLFGNPNLGTPLMQQNRLAGLDLPQKVTVYSADDGNTYTAYNSTGYLAARYGIPTTDLENISIALADLVSGAVGENQFAGTNTNVTEGEGIINLESDQDFDATYADLRAAIEDNPNLSIVAELDHQANAASVGMDLMPTKLIVFGNPNLGTPLMQNTQSINIDLPQKMLVWEDAGGTVHVAYNNPEFIADRHRLTGNTTELETIAQALSNLANAAIGS